MNTISPKKTKMAHADMPGSSSPRQPAGGGGGSEGLRHQGTQLAQHLPHLTRMLKSVFEALEGDINARMTTFWSMGLATPKIEVVNQHAAGHTWLAKANLPGHSIQAELSIALVPDETKIGVVLPATAVYHGGSDLTHKFSEAFGAPPDVQRLMPGGRVMFDRVYRTDPFSSSWMLQAIKDEAALEVLKLRLVYLVGTLWASTTHVIATTGHYRMGTDLMVFSPEALDVAKITTELPVAVFDYAQAEDSHTTVLRSRLDADELGRELKRLAIPFDRIMTLQEMGAV